MTTDRNTERHYFPAHLDWPALMQRWFDFHDACLSRVRSVPVEGVMKLRDRRSLQRTLLRLKWYGVALTRRTGAADAVANVERWQEAAALALQAGEAVVADMRASLPYSNVRKVMTAVHIKGQFRASEQLAGALLQDLQGETLAA